MLSFNDATASSTGPSKIILPRRITIPVELLGTFQTPAGEKAGFETTFTVNRLDYGITWNRLLDAGAMLGDDVEVRISVEANRQATASSP